MNSIVVQMSFALLSDGKKKTGLKSDLIFSYRGFEQLFVSDKTSLESCRVFFPLRGRETRL